MKPFLLAILVTFTAACQSDARSDPPKSAPAKSPTAKSEPAKTETPATAADYIRVVATHAEPSDDDPVVVEIPKFRVIAADFDPQKIEGGTATLELDLSSIRSGKDKRDKHLRSDDYLDVAKFGTATVKIGNVKAAGAKAYTADATVNAHGIEKTLPVRFEVLETLADGIRVKGSHTFGRLDFGIGHPPGPDDTVAEQITLELELTLRRT